jgi:acetyltransferase-like isoleucine patch superfamily enzyme
MLGIPDFCNRFTGIDHIGADCRIAQTVTVMRFPTTAETETSVRLGDRVSLYDHVRLVIGDPAQHPDTGITFGDDVIVNIGSYLSGEGGLEIGNEVLIGSHVHILSAGHVIDDADASIWRNPINYGKISISRGAWIAAGATILQGISIGEGAVVGAGAVVTRSVPDYAIVAGNPARLIRYRKGFEPPKKGWVFALIDSFLRKLR